jgi:hypothetical protein
MAKQYLKFPTGEVWAMESAAEAASYAARNPDAIILKGEKGAAALQAYTRKQLREIGVKPGATVYCVCEHVSSSGMTRHIRLLVPSRDQHNKGRLIIRDISGLAAKLCGYKQSKGGALIMGGCGMDMGFAAVYALGQHMWPKGTPKPHGRRNGEPDTAGGYALRHQWL